VAYVTSEHCYPAVKQLESQTACPQTCSMQVSVSGNRACSVRHTERKHCSMVRSDHQYPVGGIQSSVTKFRFENHSPVEVCDEWYYVVHYLKSMVNNVEETLSDFRISSVEDADGLDWYARPYRYTSDDIVDIRRLHSPDEGIYSRSTVYDTTLTDTCSHVADKYCEKSDDAFDISTDVLYSPDVSNVGSSLDKFLASTALAACNLVQFRCDCSLSRDLLQYGGPTELLSYLDAKTFYSGLLTRLDQLHNGYVLHCNNMSRQLVLDSSGLLHMESSPDPHLLSAGTSSGLTPAGNGDKQKLPNVDQLRAIQDCLAYNV